ncbi:hypothetical protein BC835DRAFT_1294885 [Cytidiella melzeri]|nr:hypothetical protein BC835DRAFT_1294885 [Cytidiella melzeri]
MLASTLLLSAFLGASTTFAFPAPRATQDLPSYVLQYAPISYLYSEEEFWPADVANHMSHVTAQESGNTIASSVGFSTIGSFASDVYLTSKDDVGSLPSWLSGNQTDSSGFTAAPATIIAVDKPGGITDAFYFYFYSYDHAEYLGLQFGDHVGDWEHSMVRFIDGVPEYLYLSAHTSGAAYNFSAVPKQGSRPVTYIAQGTHANYASTGSHQHDLPGLDDQTDAGHIWDVTKNFRGYTFDNSTKTFAVASGVSTGGALEGSEGVGWLNFPGHWGDKQYAILSKDGQYCITSTECKYVDGPTGPIAKNLGRTAPCQDESSCSILTSV